ncbi:MAG: hypothetical protein AAGC46_00295 [Solirubrobacteraceae bacterium]|nr:hypothetical protein [Patulibacter sp.]
MSGGTYEMQVAPPWGMAQIAASARQLGGAVGDQLGCGLVDVFMTDLGASARLVGEPTMLGMAHSRLGGPVTGFTLQTAGGLRVELELEQHPQATHEKQVAVRATVAAGQGAACHDEAREIMELYATIGAAGWSSRGALVEHPPSGAAAQMARGAMERGR